MVKIILIFLLALGSAADGAQAPERSTRPWWKCCGKEHVVPVRVAPVKGVDKFLQKFSNCAVDATSYAVVCGDSSASLSPAPTLTPVVKSVPVVSVAMAGGDSISSEDRVVALVPDADAVVAFSSESDVVAAVVPTLYVTCSTEGGLPVGSIRYPPGPISDDLHDVLVTTETLILAAQADTGWPVVGSGVNSMVSLYEHKKFAIGQLFQANAAGQCAAVAGFAYRSSDGARSAFFVPAMVKTIVRCYEDIIISVPDEVPAEAVATWIENSVAWKELAEAKKVLGSEYVRELDRLIVEQFKKNRALDAIVQSESVKTHVAPVHGLLYRRR